MLIVLGGVAVVAVLFQVLSGGKSKTTKNVATMVKKTASQVSGAAESLAGLGAKPAKKTDTAGTGGETWAARDPFSRPEFEMTPGGYVESAPVKVKGIIWMKGNPYVLINDVILGVGEEKQGIRIERIDGKKVVCRKGGKMYTLQWSESP